MKSVLISIQPKWCELIASGKKTIEVRKTAPKLQTPFKCYIYETKGLSSYFVEEKNTRNKGCLSKARVGGKVIGEFMCDRVDELYQCNSGYVREKACLSSKEFFAYLGIPNNTHGGYYSKAFGWHITKLKIYEEPKELGKFKKAGFLTEEQ